MERYELFAIILFVIIFLAFIYQSFYTREDIKRFTDRLRDGANKCKPIVLFIKIALWAAGITFLILTVLWVFSSFIEGERLSFLGALISAVATSFMVWFIWWRDRKAERNKRHSILYAFYGQICSVQDELIEQKILSLGQWTPYPQSAHFLTLVPASKMPTPEHNLLIYAYMDKSAIFSRLLVELREQLKDDTHFDNSNALCELLKSELKKQWPQIADFIGDPIHKIDGNLVQKEAFIPDENVMNNYKNKFSC